MTPQQLRCPACGRWLAEVAEYARVVCAACGAEVTYKSRAERKREHLDAGRVDRVAASG